MLNSNFHIFFFFYNSVACSFCPRSEMTDKCRTGRTQVTLQTEQPFIDLLKQEAAALFSSLLSWCPLTHVITLFMGFYCHHHTVGLHRRYDKLWLGQAHTVQHTEITSARSPLFPVHAAQGWCQRLAGVKLLCVTLTDSFIKPPPCCTHICWHIHVH